jgi:transposase-like protein
MTKSTRARYTLEFKEEAIRLVTNGERVAPRILACRSRRSITGGCSGGTTNPK